MFPLAKFFEIFTAGDQQYMERLSYLPFLQEKNILGVKTITEQIGTQNWQLDDSLGKDHNLSLVDPNFMKFL
jgi:hypothetical protein